MQRRKTSQLGRGNERKAGVSAGAQETRGSQQIELVASALQMSVSWKTIASEESFVALPGMASQLDDSSRHAGEPASQKMSVPDINWVGDADEPVISGRLEASLFAGISSAECSQKQSFESRAGDLGQSSPRLAYSPDIRERSLLTENLQENIADWREHLDVVVRVNHAGRVAHEILKPTVLSA
jgi:hypothetical protein